MITESPSKTILRRHPRVDSWFLSRAGMNLYRGCHHACAYCDGRAEGYYVEGEFGTDVTVKTNAIDLLRRELDPAHRRVPLDSGYIMLGGGVGDAYQPVEERYRLSRGALGILRDFGYAVHVLTKSALVERDLDLLREIDARKRAVVSFSFSTVDDGLAALFEPGASPPSLRLRAMRTFSDAGIACGMYLMPVVPLVTDAPGLLDAAVTRAAEAGACFVAVGGMTLKDGRQREHFMRILSTRAPDAGHQYDLLYAHDKWGAPRADWQSSLHEIFDTIARSRRMPQRMPSALYRDLLGVNDLVVVTLDHIDYYLKCKGGRSPYGYAAYSISQIKEPLTSLRGRIGDIKGVGKTIEGVIHEILDTGRTEMLDRLAGDSDNK